MKITPLLFVLILTFLSLSQAKQRCNDNSQCFIKKLFDFSFPSQNVYNIALSNTPTMNNQIRSYGDFNNDLRTDYISIDSSNNILIFIYNIDQGQYDLVTTIQSQTNCPFSLNFYLYDINGDNQLDITVWGQQISGGGLGNVNCFYPLMQDNLGFKAMSVIVFNTTTTQPILFETRMNPFGSSIRVTGLLLFNPNTTLRTIYFYDNNQYVPSQWNKLFSGSAAASIPFSNQHWNMFADITSDCYPDFIFTSQPPGQSLQLQFWIYNWGVGMFYQVNVTLPPSLNTVLLNLKALSLIDVNYDGGLDLIFASNNQLTVILNSYSLTSDYIACTPAHPSFSFNWNNPIIFSPEGCTLQQQNLQWADLDIDGYPEVMLLCSNPQKLLVFQNMFESGGSFSIFQKFQSKINEFVKSDTSVTILTASFFDILQNGIIDFIITQQNNQNGFVSLALYNNYLYQNSFYIKGFGTNSNGQISKKGTQVPGISFYWLNSVGNSPKMVYTSQLTSTAYNSIPMPYVVTGLGRANNYVQMFTMARLGEKKSWSPIIPNSQLAIFSGADRQQWKIKIFVLPTDSLVYVIIVCVIILAILGVALLTLKCQKKKKEQPLLADYM